MNDWTSARRLGAPLAALALLLSLFAPGSARAQETLEDVMMAAGKAYVAGQKCLEAGRKPGANSFLENEKAIGHLEQAQRLLERYLGARPDDPEGNRMMMDVASLLFWCHKMSPMVDPEELEPDEPVEDDEPTAGPAPTEPETPEPAGPDPEVEAERLLGEARAYREENPDDGMGALAKFFMVAEQFPETTAGKAARGEAEQLQATLFAKPPAPPAPPKPQPLDDDDRRDIEELLREWLSKRQDLRCSSCKGEGASPCRKCDGTGKLRGRAGRVATCNKCRRGMVPCKRSSCAEGVDSRILEKVVVDFRAPYYREKLKALLGGGRKAIEQFVWALGAYLADSPRAPAEISRCASELGIEPVQLRDIIEAHGPDRALLQDFTTYSLGEIKRVVKYTIRGDAEVDEAVSFEQQDGTWYLRELK